MNSQVAVSPPRIASNHSPQVPERRFKVFDGIPCRAGNSQVTIEAKGAVSSDTRMEVALTRMGWPSFKALLGILKW